jgi:hypothetical protein
VLVGIKIPKLDVTEQLKKVESEFTPLLKSAEELEQFSKKRLEEIKAEIAELDDEMVLDPALFAPCHASKQPVRAHTV